MWIEQEFSNLGYNVSVCNTGGSIQECDRYFRDTVRETDETELCSSALYSMN